MPPEGFTPMQTGLVQAGSSAAGGLISGAFNALANYNNRKFNAEQAQLNRDWNSHEAQLARDFQLQMWNKQNAYDSPAAKMQRYIEAGLNPNLVYGELGGVGSPLPSVAQASGGSAAHSSISNPFAIDTKIPLLQAQLTEAQIKRLENQNENDTKMTEASVIDLLERAGYSKASAVRAYSEIPLIEAKVNEAKQAFENMKQQWDILDENKKQQRFQTAFVEATQGMRIAGANAEQEAIAKTAVGLAFANLANINADTALKWMQTSESQSQIRLNNAQMSVARNQAYFLSAQIKTEGLNQQRIVANMAQLQNYNMNMFRQEGDSFVVRGFKWLITEPADALSQMLGNIINVGL